MSVHKIVIETFKYLVGLSPNAIQWVEVSKEQSQL